MKEWCTICGSFHELTTAGCPTMIKNVTASTNNIEVRYTRADLDKAVADEREEIIEEGERIYDQFVCEGGASPSLKAKGVGTFIQAIRNRGNRNP